MKRFLGTWPGSLLAAAVLMGIAWSIGVWLASVFPAGS